MRLVDGRVIPYRLLLKQKGKQISVREEFSNHLPAFCPERHINYDGTFCLSYPAVNPLNITDKPSAVAWLETLYTFLRLQERARVKRKWPNTDEWAHGGAAYHQLRAIKAASALNKMIGKAALDGEISVRSRYSQGKPILDVWVGTSFLYSVWENDKRVINQTKRCFCMIAGLRLPKKLRRCRDHAKQATELAFAVRDWQNENEHYWESMKERTCCGTCDSCPLPRTP